eukprot:1074608-Rhodomonas_salina.4
MPQTSSGSGSGAWAGIPEAASSSQVPLPRCDGACSCVRLLHVWCMRAGAKWLGQSEVEAGARAADGVRRGLLGVRPGGSEAANLGRAPLACVGGRQGPRGAGVCERERARARERARELERFSARSLVPAGCSRTCAVVEPSRLP